MIHHTHHISHMCYDAHIMGHKQNCRSVLSAQFHHDMNGLFLHRYIKRTGRFVCKKELWVIRHSHSDRHTLAHSPAQFKRITSEDAVRIRAEARCAGETGVEMEALTAVSAAALTIYDMCKAVQRDMEIGQIHLCRKSGGRSGDYERKWDDG